MYRAVVPSGIVTVVGDVAVLVKWTLATPVDDVGVEPVMGLSDAITQ